MTTSSRTAASLRVRMYRVGFGDCFLVTLACPGGPFRMLVDCGVHSGGDAGTLARVVNDIVAQSEHKLDVVVATHMHEDHISGFGKCADAFSQIEVGEVWLPWTEDPDDAQGRRLRRKTLALAEALMAREDVLGVGSQAAAMVLNAARNPKALETLHSGFLNAPQVRYLQAGDLLSELPGAKGVSVEVLGPPREEAFLGRLDPPSGKGYLASAPPPSPGSPNKPPFPPSEVVSAADYGINALDAESIKELKAAAAEPLAGLALALDQAVNNTSLVFVLTFKGKRLLFAGDAQYGSWDAWLSKDGSAELLDRIDFYKVSHHGSHNGTPRAAVEGFRRSRVAAMVSTQTKPWKSIPRLPLMEALADRTGGRFLRSDGLPTTKRAAARVAAARPPSEFHADELWIDWVPR